jgi:hypothetical protein
MTGLTVLAARSVLFLAAAQDLIADKSSKKAPLKKKIKPTPKPKKEKPFRFLDLPPELRDMIYEMALTDVNGVGIVAKTRGYRRTAGRGPVYASSSYRRSGWGWGRRQLKHDSTSVVDAETKFVPALLAVNKQINLEGINYLYGQDFVFEKTVALEQFLAIIGPQNQQRLLSVELVSWTKTGVSKSSNYSALTLLAGATNLQSLVFDCALNGWGTPAETLALQIYRDGHHFMEAYGRANGSKDAVVDIIELDDENFDPSKFYAKAPSSIEEGRARFEAALRRLLQAAR